MRALRESQIQILKYTSICNNVITDESSKTDEVENLQFTGKGLKDTMVVSLFLAVKQAPSVRPERLFRNCSQIES